MNKIESLKSEFPDVELIIADGFDDAILGYDVDNGRIVYSISLCIEILIDNEGMNEEDALDHFYYNVKGSYIGERTPLYIH